MSPEGVETLISLVTALLAGLLIGAERQQGDRRGLFAGIRTFPLFALAGALGMLVGEWLLFGLAIGLSGLIALAYFRAGGPSRVGTSTETAALVTFSLGALCTARDLPLRLSDRLILVGAGASMVMGLLSLKQPLQTFLKKVSWNDIYATAKLLLLAVILLPVLPNSYVGPFEALNPQRIGIFVVLVSTLSFAGYIAVRMLGPSRGLAVTGFFGGLASSTAVTVSFASKARLHPSLLRPCAFAIVLASTTMFPRMMVYTWVTSPELGRASLLPFTVASIVGLIGAGILTLRNTQSQNEESSASLVVENPFDLSHAFRFGLIFTLVLLISKAASLFFQARGALISSAVAGLISVDAVTLSVGKLADQALLTSDVAVDAIGLAALANTLTKVGLSIHLGGRALGIRVGAVLITAIAAGFLTRVLTL